MNKLLSACFFLIFLVSGIIAQSFAVATYNIRFDNPNDSLDLWKTRSSALTELIQFHNFDIFGTQEGLKNQLIDIKTMLPQYDYIGVGRNDGKEDGEYAAIFYKPNQFKLVQQGNFWLSTVTDRPNVGWDAAYPRICTWGKFTEKASGLTFFVFNVHFDHKGVQARQESAKLILTKVKEIAGKAPAILTGDFNVDETNESYLLLKNSELFKDAFEIAEVKLAPNGTFNEFNVNIKPVGRIDHIFLTKEFEVQRFGILTNTYNGRYPSDHFPVMVKIKYKKQK